MTNTRERKMEQWREKKPIKKIAKNHEETRRNVTKSTKNLG